MQPKRIIVTLLAVILICLAAVTTVSAAEASPVKLGVSVSSDTAVSNAPVTVQAGDTLKVSVTVAENPGIRILQFNLVYDPAVLSVKTEGSVVPATWGEGFSDENNKVVTLVKPGVLKVMISASKAIKTETIVTFDFTAIACVAEKKGETTIATDVKDGAAMDSFWNQLTLAADTAKVAVHDELVELEAEESPCVTAGLKCSTCGAIPVETTANHSMKPVAEVPATCTATGTTAGEKCENCDHKTGLEEIPMLDHDLANHGAQAPTCTDKGWEAYQACKNCDYTTKVEIPALDHDLKDVAAKAPTCTEDGWNAYQECQREGCDYNTKVVLPALGHDLKQVAAKAANCFEIGWNAYEECQRGCGHTTYVEIPQRVHDLKQVEAKAPNCFEDGWKAYEECQHEDCDYTTYEVVPKLNHDLKAFDAQAVTCLVDGWNAYQACQREGCGYTTQEIIKAPGKHTPVADPEVPPTYSTEGKTAGSHCSACGEIIVAQEVIPVKSLLWLWILIAAVVVAAAGVVVYFFVFKKQAKTKHIGRPGSHK